MGITGPADGRTVGQLESARKSICGGGGGGKEENGRRHMMVSGFGEQSGGANNAQEGPAQIGSGLSRRTWSIRRSEVEFESWKSVHRWEGMTVIWGFSE